MPLNMDNLQRCMGRNGVKLTLPRRSCFETGLMHTLVLVHAKEARLVPCVVIAKTYFDGVRVLSQIPGFSIAEFESIVKILDDRGRC